VLSDEMTSYLCNFVASGNPNGGGLPEWKKCTSSKDVMIFGDSNTKSGKVDMKKLIVTTMTNKPVGE
jgi:para-nitrobenzyl esterase